MSKRSIGHSGSTDDRGIVITPSPSNECNRLTILQKSENFLMKFRMPWQNVQLEEKINIFKVNEEDE